MKNKAFTLIELLVVIAIIGILASVVIASLNSARGKARDARRMSDMKALQTALEMYYADNGAYPPGSNHYTNSPDSICTNLTTTPLTGGVWTTVFNASFRSQYLSTLPEDPGGYCYTYTNAAGSTITCTPVGGSPEYMGSFFYVLTFRAEGDLTGRYAVRDASANTYCVLGPRR